MHSQFYIPQDEQIKNLVHSIWQIGGLTRFQKEYIIPKGVVEIIFNFSDDPSIPAQFDKKQYHLSHCFISGFNTVPVQIQLPKHQSFFGVTLQPLAIKKILGAPSSEFLDAAIDLTLIDPAFCTLWHRLAEQQDFNTRVAIFSGWMEKKFFDCQPRERWINDFLTGSGQHEVSVSELAGLLCYSPRQLSRKISEATGMNTEEILLYKKYLHAVHLIHHTDQSLTEIAYQSHFADQSHFIKSFRDFTNMTPGEYKRNKSHLKGHLYENVR